jgi:PAS domain-containing protein
MNSAVTFSLVYLLAAAIALAAVAVIWPRRSAPGGTPLALMLMAAAFWAVCDAIELHLPTVDGKRLISQIQYIGVIAAAPFFFHAAMALSGRTERLRPGLLAAVWAVPLASLLFAWTNPWHNWLWTGIELPSGNLPFARYQYGWWFWVLTAQHYLLMVAATLLLVGAIRRVRRPFRTGMTALLIAVILPWIGNAAYNAKIGPWPGLNWLTLSLGVSGSLLVWVVLREGLLDLLPRAREALLDKMTDGVLVLDREGRVIIANEAARGALPLDGSNLARALGLDSLSAVPEQWRTEAQVGSESTRRWLDVRIDPIRDRWGALAGRLVVARDVTFQKALEDEREHLIDELQAALKKVVQLEGLLPICASCRKVRDDGGYWGHVEEYFGSRAPVEFTHAICPDCEQKLYPSIVKS